MLDLYSGWAVILLAIIDGIQGFVYQKTIFETIDTTNIQDEKEKEAMEAEAEALEDKRGFWLAITQFVGSLIQVVAFGLVLNCFDGLDWSNCMAIIIISTDAMLDIMCDFIKEKCPTLGTSCFYMTNAAIAVTCIPLCMEANKLWLEEESIFLEGYPVADPEQEILEATNEVWMQ